ncbi:MAG: hypothetical protein B7Y97_13300 [Sphingomonas sp. 32-66-10]|nr:MAG: hypothetical protein B7Y97_13300 [Sphingomonas sp. 32-66-10]
MTRWIAAAFAISLCPIAASAQADLSAAVAGPGRPVDQIALDAGRKPAEVLAFLGLKPGDVAADIMAGSGYYTEIMARAVGPKGLVYHDLYWESAQYKVPRVDPAAFLKSLYAATKPGGIVGVVDHVGAAGDTRAIVDALHRIDPAVIKADFKAAGFILEGESPLLRVVGDDIAKLVFDPAVRGKTDRVVYRFRKPG